MVFFLKVFIIVLVILFILGYVAKRILYDYSSVPKKSNISLTVNTLRDLVGKTGPLPVRINVLRVATGTWPAGIAVAGQGKKKYNFQVVSYQVVYDNVLPGGGNTIIIEAVMDKSQSKLMAGDTFFDDAKYSLLQKGLKKASTIIVTHEDFDHIGGIAMSPFIKEIIGKTILTDEQVASPIISKAGFSNEMLVKCKKLTYEGSHILSPGIVVIKTPGHTPGHQIVYVKLLNGNEYLIAGDIAWNMDNITMLKQQTLITCLVKGENRYNLGNQLRWLHDEIYTAHKEIRLLIHHDQNQHDEYIKQGLLGNGFEL